MIINYPTHYVVPVSSVISLDEDKYSVRCSGENNFNYNMEEDEVYKTYINENKDVFLEIDEEYVNESIK